MKTNSFKIARTALLLGSACLALGATSLLAEGAASGGMSVPPPGLRSGLYLATDAGLNLADDLAVSGGSVSLSPGVRWDFSMGYAIKLADNLTLAPEVECGIIYNALDNASAGHRSASASGSFWQVPLMANVVLNWQFYPHWVLYGGGGAGLDYNTLSVDSVNGYGIYMTGSESDFAWQGMAGIKYVFGSSELGVGWKYLAVQPSGLQTVGNNAFMLSYTVHF